MSVAVASLAAAVAGQWLIDLGTTWIGLVVALAGAAALVATRPPGLGPPGARAWPAQTPPLRATTLALAGCASLGLASALAFDIDEPHIAFWLVHAATAVAAVVATALDDWPRADRAIDGDAHLQLRSAGWTTIAFATAVTGVSLAFRLSDLAGLPEGFWFDEADHADVARQIEDGELRPLWVGGTYAAPGHHAYLIAAASKLGLGAVTSVRSVSVTFGLVAMLGAYLVGRELLGRTGGLLMLAIIGLARWPVTLSRIGMFNIATPACLLLGLGLILTGIRRDELTVKLLGGMTLGFGLCFHSSMWPGLAGVVGLLLLVSADSPSTRRALWVPAVGAVVLAAPVLGVAIRDVDLYTARQHEVSVFNDANSDDTAGDIAGNTRAVLGMFNVAGDDNGRHNIPGEPQLSPVVGGLVILGLGIVVIHWSTPLALAVLVWGAAALVPGVVTIATEAPNAVRVVAVLPVIAILAAAAGTTILQGLPARSSLLALAIIACALAGWTVKDYFVDWRNDPEVWAAHSMGETIAAETAEAASRDGHEVAALGEFAHSVVGGVLAPGSFDAVVPDTAVYPVAVDGDTDATLIVGPPNRALIDEHRRRYGAGAVTEHRRGDRAPATVIELAATDIRARQGLSATYGKGAGAVTVDERIPGARLPSLIATSPVTFTWEGVLVVEHPGRHALWVDGATEVVATVDGETVDPDDVELHAGPHWLSISGRLRTTVGVRLRWQHHDGQPSTISPRHLWLMPDGPSGLWAQAFGGRDGTGDRSASRLDAAVDFVIGDHDAPRPRLVRWDGYLEAPRDGFYLIGLETPAEWELRIDGRTVDVADQRVLLTSGLHRLDVLVVDEAPGFPVRLNWTPPDGQQETIPSTALTPPWALSTDEARELAATTPPVERIESMVLDTPFETAVAVGAGADVIAVADASGSVWISRHGTGRVVHTDGPVADLAVGENGEVVVLDPGGRLLVIAPDGEPELWLEDPRLTNARGLSLLRSGDALVAATQDGSVLSIGPDGEIVRLLEEVDLGQPVDVAPMDETGLIVVDGETSLVRGFSADDARWEVPTAPSPTTRAPHVAAAGARIFVTDPVLGEIIESTRAGGVTAIYELTTDHEPVVSPVGIAVTTDARILVVDAGSGQVLAVRPRASS